MILLSVVLIRQAKAYLVIYVWRNFIQQIYSMHFPYYSSMHEFDIRYRTLDR
jgi:hypothetical protein